MKKINFKITILLLALIGVYSCDEADPELLGDITAYSFDPSATSVNLSVPVESTTLELPIISTTLSSVDRNVQVTVESVSENSNTGEYTVGSITIPADSYFGTLSIDFNYDAIDGADGDIKNITLSIVEGAGYTVYRNTTSIDYFREIICNDLVLNIVSDVWAAETYFSLRALDDSGNVTANIVERFFPFGGNSLTPQEVEFDVPLADGNYRYEMGDTFGDGMVGSFGDVTLVGSYSLTCSIITHAEGSGEFSPPVSDAFAGAPDAIIEVTDFTVNP